MTLSLEDTHKLYTRLQETCIRLSRHPLWGFFAWSIDLRQSTDIHKDLYFVLIAKKGPFSHDCLIFDQVKDEKVRVYPDIVNANSTSRTLFVDLDLACISKLDQHYKQWAQAALVALGVRTPVPEVSPTATTV